MKKIFIIILLIVLFGGCLMYFNTAYAAEAGEDLSSFIPMIYNWSISIVGSLATLILIYAGYLYATSAGNPEQANLAKEYIIGAISGMVLLLMAVIVYNMIKVEENPFQGASGTSSVTPGINTQQTTPSDTSSGSDAGGATDKANRPPETSDTPEIPMLPSG